MSARRRSGSVYVSVSVPVDEIFDDISDADFHEEFERRNLAPPMLECDLEDVLEMLRRRDFQEAELLLDRLLHPKFRNIRAVMAALAEAKQ